MTVTTTNTFGILTTTTTTTTATTTDDYDDNLETLDAIFLVISNLENSEMEARKEVLAAKIENVYSTLKSRLIGNESDAAIKKLDSKNWDELYPGANTK